MASIADKSPQDCCKTPDDNADMTEQTHARINKIFAGNPPLARILFLHHF
jgi:hypothetical protein